MKRPDDIDDQLEDAIRDVAEYAEDAYDLDDPAIVMVHVSDGHPEWDEMLHVIDLRTDDRRDRVRKHYLDNGDQR